MKSVFKYNHIVLLSSLILFMILMSCRKEEAISDNPSLKLSFSADSVIFDTVFTSIGSATKQLRVYNHSTSKIKISNLRLGLGEQSAYRINVDGESGNSFSDIELSGSDSLYIFVRVTIDPQNINNPYVVEDDIYFLTNGNEQSIKLVAWGQDAVYILADTYIEGLPPFKIVADSLETIHWTNQKPYVVYGYAVINSYGKLIIDEGARIYFHEGSGLWAYIDGVLNVLGSVENPVTFRGDRLEQEYSDIPGQWDRIWLMEGRPGHDHIIENAVISNAFIGLQAESFLRITENKVKLHNVIIENMTGIGIFSRVFNITANNTVVANCGGYNLAFTGGGNYSFIQSTIAGYWPYSVRNTPAIFINNYLIDTLDQPVPIAINFNFANSILYGFNSDEFETDMDGGADSLYFFNSSIIKTKRDVSNTEIYTNILKNEDPLFVNYEANDYRIDSLSPAVGRANEAIGATVPRDILDNSRLPIPDIGAYQFVPSQGGGEEGGFKTMPLRFSNPKLFINKKGNYPKLNTSN
ncbi:MAG: hypothetical protein H8E34_05795 [Bacteroidetes bacterium]|nr:hypothetical protein [Bacteroidota bacterium]MBL6943864.1 hypothetical protein [Bacteroidales bacterium]